MSDYSENCDYITSVECIGSAGETMPPMLLISGVIILRKWCQHIDLDSNIMIKTTKTGYANDDIALEWLRHLIDHTQNKGTARLTPVFATLTPFFATLTPCGRPNQNSKVFQVSHGTKSASLFEVCEVILLQNNYV